MLWILWAVASLWYPFGWDHGMHAMAGDAVVRGGLPYRDAWELKGPLTFYLFALAQLLFGRNMWAIRVLDLAILLPTLWVLFRAVDRVAPAAGRWAALAFGLLYATMGWFFTAQPDGWVACWMILAMAPLIGREDGPSLRALSWAGFWIGCSAGIKPFYLLLGLVPAVAAWRARGSSVAQRVSGIAIVGLTSGLVVALGIGWFAFNDALPWLQEVQLDYNTRSYARLRSLQPMRLLTGILTWFATAPVVFAVPALAIGAFTAGQRPWRAIVGTWCGVALVCVTLQGKFWTYHWFAVLPPLVVMGTVGFARLAAAGHERVEAKIAVWTMAALVFGTLSLGPARDVVRWGQFATGSLDRATYHGAFKEWLYVASDQVAAAEWIRERTDPDDGVVVFGNDATVPFLAERSGPTRFIYGMPLTRGPANGPKAAYRVEYLADLVREPPRYFVVGMAHRNADKAAVLGDFAKLEQFLARKYELEVRIGNLDLYRRIR